MTIKCCILDIRFKLYLQNRIRATPDDILLYF